MIWPFKKKPPTPTVEEWASQFPTPPCGDNTTHYEWEKINGMVCPKCYADRKRQERNAELDALADKIAERLLKQCAASGQLSAAQIYQHQLAGELK